MLTPMVRKMQDRCSMANTRGKRCCLVQSTVLRRSSRGYFSGRPLLEERIWAVTAVVPHSVLGDIPSTLWC